MAARKTKQVVRRPRTGVFVYCTPEQRRLLKDAARERGQTLSGYVLSACLRRLGRTVTNGQE